MNPQKKFWKWVRNKTPALENPGEVTESRTLFLNGTIAEESWFDDDVTPALFRSDLNNGTGDITVWINSPGGDCFAAAQIYNMLRDYKGKVTVKIDGLAASAASVIAMAGDEVLVSPVSMIMIHNPSTIAMGDTAEMQKAIEMLSEVKASIINAYQEKTGLSRNKLSKLMDEETWMDAGKAVELHFADGVINRDELYGTKTVPETWEEEKAGSIQAENEEPPSSMLFSRYQVAAAMNKKLCDYARRTAALPDSEMISSNNNPPDNVVTTQKYRIDDLEKRLDLMKQFV